MQIKKKMDIISKGGEGVLDGERCSFFFMVLAFELRASCL
jgi:hypothetical protein